MKANVCSKLCRENIHGKIIFNHHKKNKLTLNPQKLELDSIKRIKVTSLEFEKEEDVNINNQEINDQVFKKLGEIIKATNGIQILKISCPL